MIPHQLPSTHAEPDAGAPQQHVGTPQERPEVPPKPSALPLEPHNIPIELTRRPQWVVWRYERERDKWDKPPRQSHNPTLRARTNDASTWAGFERAVQAYREDDLDGIGFVATTDDPYVFLDFDDCVDATGQLDPRVQEDIDLFGSYAELSPSGTGVRVIIRGRLDHLDGKSRYGSTEVYAQGQYLTLTGHCIGRPVEIKECQAELDRWYAKRFANRTVKPVERTPVDTSGLRRDDEELLGRMFASSSGDRIKALWGGDLHAYDGDQSRADLALVGHLGRWTQYDAARVDDLFRRSGLHRPKWDERHSKEGLTYGAMTISKAFAGRERGNGYQAGASPSTAPSGRGDGEPGLLAFPRTQAGDAERLVAQHGQDLRYCDGIGWLVWNGRIWERDPGEKRVIQFALATMRVLQRQANEVTDTAVRDLWSKHALKGEGWSRLADMVQLARTMPGIQLIADDLDSDPWLFNVENGTIDLRTGAIRPHDRSDLITSLAPVAHDPNAKAPLWAEFQECICGGDQGLVEFKQRALGYSLTGSTKEEVLFIAYGTGANGKTTELNIINRLAGDYATTAQFDTFAVRRNDSVRNDIADLRGARIVSASEGESGQQLAEGLVKQLTGGDRVKARFLHQEHFTYTPAFKVWLATNHKPKVRGTDNGIWRRLRLVPYKVTIPVGQRDKDLKEKLEGELPGILNWLIDGCLAWQQRGLGEPDAVREATADYRRESDALLGYLEACCDLSDSTAQAVPSRDLHKTYARWCEQNGEEALTLAAFGRVLTERGHESVSARVNGEPSKVRKGITLTPHGQALLREVESFAG